MYLEKYKLHEREKAHKPGMLRTLALDVTNKCNMHCPHCYAETFAKVQPITLEFLKKIFEEAYQMGVFHYVLEGGEAIIDFERLESIINLIYPNETYINIVSNGWAVDKACIKKLKSLQVDKITFSLDSGIEKEHDKNRCEGSFRKVIKAVEEVLNQGLLTGISTVVTHESLYSEGFKQAYDFAKQKDIRFDIQIAMPVGKWEANGDVLINEVDAQYIKELYNKSVIMKNGQKMIKRDIYSGEVDHCPAGTEMMSITADGNLLPCNFIQASLGNIKDKTLKEMRDKLLTSQWFSEIHSYCICGESEEYFREFIAPNVSKQKPLDANALFSLE